MNQRILVGVDATVSPPTQQALCTIGTFLATASPQLHVVLLHVIPVPALISRTSMPSMRQPHLVAPPTSGQRTQAEQALWSARTLLQQRGIAAERIEILLRVGTPTDELVKAAKELHVEVMVLGSRGDSLGQQVRRVVTGSTSRRVLRLAPCPVMLVVPPRMRRPRRLVAWYEEAITRCLQASPQALSVFTPYEVAERFLPPNRTLGYKEVEAASRALECLASKGVLSCHTVSGEARYTND